MPWTTSTRGGCAACVTKPKSASGSSCAAGLIDRIGGAASSWHLRKLRSKMLSRGLHVSRANRSTHTDGITGGFEAPLLYRRGAAAAHILWTICCSAARDYFLALHHADVAIIQGPSPTNTRLATIVIMKARRFQDGRGNTEIEKCADATFLGALPFAVVALWAVHTRHTTLDHMFFMTRETKDLSRKRLDLLVAVITRVGLAVW
mmetsp:Transcript_124859/g.286086  ORF Transcript_124859/g.286086 Transcript_124859/m.286086 type:complete len:205 (-) Transcript_124859:611-1225(-)